MKRIKHTVYGFNCRMLKVTHKVRKLRNKDIVYRINGKKIMVPATVFQPLLGTSSKFMATHMQHVVSIDDKVLDLGTGCGIVAIFAAQKSGRVIATDISPYAIQATLNNIRINGMTEDVDVRLGNMYEPVSGEKFDIIVTNIPFFPKEPKDMIERSWYCGKDYDLPKRFFSNLSSHFTKNGKAYVAVSSLIGTDWIMSECEKHNLSASVVSRKHMLFSRILIIKIVQNRVNSNL